MYKLLTSFLCSLESTLKILISLPMEVYIQDSNKYYIGNSLLFNNYKKHNQYI